MAAGPTYLHGPTGLIAGAGADSKTTPPSSTAPSIRPASVGGASPGTGGAASVASLRVSSGVSSWSVRSACSNARVWVARASLVGADSTRLNARSDEIAIAWRRKWRPSSYSNHTDGRPAASFSLGPASVGPTCMRSAVSLARSAHAYFEGRSSWLVRQGTGHEQYSSRVKASAVSSI